MNSYETVKTNKQEKIKDIKIVIYNEEYELGIIWDISLVNGTWIYGNINFIIEGEIIPKNFSNKFTLATVFLCLKRSFEKKSYSAGQSLGELGNKEVDYIKLDYGEEVDIFSIDITELADYHLLLDMGYSGDNERLFYSKNFGKTYKEVVMRKGTLESIIMQLPNHNELKSMANSFILKSV